MNRSLQRVKNVDRPYIKLVLNESDYLILELTIIYSKALQKITTPGLTSFAMIPHCISNYIRALIVTRKIATSSPQQTRDDVGGIISKSRHGDVAAILRTNKVTPYTIHRGATANAFTEIRAISGRLPLSPPHYCTVISLHCMTALFMANRIGWSLFCFGVYPLSVHRPPQDVLIDRPVINA